LAEFNIPEIQQRKPDLWRYQEALPSIDSFNRVSFSEGYTPLIPVKFHNRQVLIKQEHLFQTGSYKDRGAALLISWAKELGIRHVVEDSSGNSGCAIAAYSARAGIKCDIYVPDSTSPGKLIQIRSYGANLHLIPGSREDTARAVLEAAQSTYYASHSWNPFFFQGTKTFAYEIWQQLDFQAPQALILPAGNGTLILGAWLGFKDLLNAGMISHMPRLFAVQAENCAPLYHGFLQGLKTPVTVQPVPTLAEGIAIAEPVRGSQIIQAVTETGGDFQAVTEQQIRQSITEMHAQGFYIEPTSAAITAAIPQIIERHPEIEIWVSAFTGHGLKSTEKLQHLQKFNP